MTIIDIERPAVTHEEPAAGRSCAGARRRRTGAAGHRPAAAAPGPPRRPAVRRPGRARSAGRGASPWSVAWVVVMAVGLAVEPAPANPDAPVPSSPTS